MTHNDPVFGWWDEKGKKKRNILKKEQHATEKRFPEQCEEFKNIVETMYQLHLDKNYDYSPYNMLSTGLIGATTRLWDKMARLMNLMGFDIATGKYTGEKEGKNESIDDTLLDMANYAVIFMILRKKRWGK